MIKSTKFSAVADFEHKWLTVTNQTTLLQQKLLPDSAIICHDMVRVLSVLLRDEGIPETTVPKEVDCSNFTTDWELPSLSKLPAVDGFTGNIQFNNDEERISYNLTIIEATRIALKKLGQWSDSAGLQVVSPQSVTPSSAPLQSLPAIRVTSILNRPFLVKNSEGQLEGFVADLVAEMSTALGREFTINVVKDGYYGKFTTEGQWNGMIGELIRGEADVVIADLTKTQPREAVVDFGKNFFSVGLNILMHKPANTEVEPRGMVWGPWILWIASIFGAGLLAAAAGYGLSKYLGAPDRIRALETKSTDNLSPCGSCWFSIGTMLGRDVGIYPRSFGHRLWSLIWWIFCFLVLAAYISSITSDLIEKRSSGSPTHTRMTSHQAIEEFLEKGSPVIGAVTSGSTVSLFKASLVGSFREIGEYMSRHPEAQSPSNNAGAQRVRKSKGNYAFIMESPLSEYHINQMPCDLMVTSGYLNTVSYALAVPKNSELMDDLDHALLTVIERGNLREIYERWWHNYTDTCDDPNMDALTAIYHSSMTLEEVSSVFYILIVGTVFTLCVAVLEYFVIKRRSVSLD